MNIAARLLRIEAARTAHWARLAAPIDATTRAARTVNSMARVEQGTTDWRCLRIAELVGLAQQRQEFASLA